MKKTKDEAATFPTTHVQSSAAFESALHVRWRVDQLSKSRSKVFSEDKNSSVAVLAVGLSGLLISRKLAHVGDKNVAALEQKPKKVVVTKILTSCKPTAAFER
jgi:hypothetical protein